MLPILPGRRSVPSALPWTNPNPAPTVPILGFFNMSQPQSMPLFNQENIPFPVPAIWNQPWTLPPNPNPTISQCLVRGRPILGRRNDPNRIEETVPNGISGATNGHITNGDSAVEESDKGVKRICRPPSPVENWAINCNNNNIENQVTRKCGALAAAFPHQAHPLLGVNMAVPPPPIPTQPVPPSVPPGPRAKENEYYFRPIQQVPCNPVELHVTNLDQSIDLREMKKQLMAAFREHVMVLHVSVFVQSDGSVAASVKVPSEQDAQYAISQLQRRKVGFKRILINRGHNATQNPQIVKNQIISLLLEVPGHKMPLFTFRDLFASRFLIPVSVSDLYRMRDVCSITEESGGRTIALVLSAAGRIGRESPSPALVAADASGPEPPFCVRHSNQLANADKGWAEPEQPNVINVKVRLSELAERVTSLVHSHDNRLPLASLPDCYAAQFEPLEIVESGGAPLEHLVTCIGGLELVHSGGSKALRIAAHKLVLENKNDESIALSVSPSLAGQVHLFGRELVDLLKTQPSCQLQFNRFIPAYHHHFGRQCRVADYGFTKLIDLLETLPHVVQVIGDGSKRIVTLSHRAQMRRFTSDLLRVLKSQASKQMLASELPQHFERTLSRPFEPSDYGLCHLEDLLGQLPANVVLVAPAPGGSGPAPGGGGDTLIAIPKREQTAEEIERTKQFAMQVIELLSHAPQCTMEFAKFIPAYHHHYGTQCRVSDFGFTKLIELFEAIPHVVKIDEECEGDRKVTLTLPEKLKVLANQMSELVEPRYPPGLPLDEINSVYLWQFGYGLKPSSFGCSTINEVLENLSTVKIVDSGEKGWLIVPAEKTQSRTLAIRILGILWPHASGRLSLDEFHKEFVQQYNSSISTQALENDLQGVIEVSGDHVQLTTVQLFGRDVYHLLASTPDGRLPLASFESAFMRVFGAVPTPAQFGMPSMSALLRSVDAVVSVIGHGTKRMLLLNPELADVIRRPTTQSHLKGAHLKMNNDRPKREGGVKTVWKKGAGGFEPSVVIQLPEPRTPPSAEQCMALLSPAKFLLPRTSYFPFAPSPPDPSALPPPPPHFNLTQN